LYNTVHPHKALGYRSPASSENSWWKKDDRERRVASRFRSAFRRQNEWYEKDDPYV
jgi:hypothetical protein